ncbi:hypothetical protein [Bacillus cereus]|uniref:hypothetical protein n=1 Tax=Bacillus cereus TaxID=1396 RepID=UPI003C12C5C8
MPSLFKTMEFQLKTERLDLSMWEESDSVWMRKLIGERGVDMPTLDSVRNRLIEMRINDWFNMMRCEAIMS